MRGQFLSTLFCIFTSAALAGCGGRETATIPTYQLVPSTLRQSNSTAHHASRPQAQGWESFGYDLQRTGYNPNETFVGTGNVGNLQKLWSFNVGTRPMREPVLATGVMINGNSTNVLYAGSSYGSVLYALNAQTGAVIWHVPLPYVKFYCDSAKQFGIGATPAIDSVHGRLYVADGADRIHALSLSQGTEFKGWPVTIGMNPAHNNVHAGLTYNPVNRTLYAATSSICDYIPWEGRITAINTASARISGVFYPVSGTSQPGGNGGGIWGGGGASIDTATNNVLIATGNSDETGGQQNVGYAEHVVLLTPNLNQVLAANYPPNMPSGPTLTDLDFGSTPMIFTPPGCPEMATALNKSGMLELYDMSTISEGPVEGLDVSIAQDNGDFQGETVYDPVTNYVYVGLPATFGIYEPGMAAFSILSNCTLDPAPAWNAAFGPDGAPTQTEITRSPITIANGVVYIANSTGNTEFAFDATTGARLWSTHLAGIGKAGTIVANGIVYVTDNLGNITAWTPPPHPLQRPALSW